MCSWDTTPDEVDAFAADVARACESARGRLMSALDPGAEVIRRMSAPRT